jgi:hypothetical protein
MPIDVEHLRQHYASLSEEEFDELDRNDLTEVAQKCYDHELERRGFRRSREETADAARDRTPPPAEPDEFPDEEPFVACAFREDRGLESAQNASEASAALQASGIPSRIELREVEEENTSQRHWTEYQVIVPNGMSLQAASVLDRDFFNIRTESDWKTHLESLSDEQLLRLDADAMCEGLLDRAARLKKAYNNEVQRRRL